METKPINDLLTQKNIKEIAFINKIIRDNGDQVNANNFQFVQESIEPYIMQANDSIAHGTGLMDRIIDVLMASNDAAGRFVRRDENIDIGALGAKLKNSNCILNLCSTAYAQLESIGLKVRDAIVARQVGLAQGNALLQNIIDLGERYDDAVRHLWTTHRWLMFYPTAVQRELDDLTEDGLVLFNRFSGNDNLLSAETLQADLAILKKYQEIMDRMADRAYVIGCKPGGSAERNLINGLKNQAREIERAILNKLNKRINNLYSNLVDLTNKSELNADDIKNATTILSNIDAVAHYYNALLDGIHNQLTEYDANTLIRNKQAIDADAMQTAVIHGILVVQGLVNCVNNFHNKVQKMGRTGRYNDNPNFNVCVAKCDAAKVIVNDFGNNFFQAWYAFSYSPLRTQREIDHFINDKNQIVVTIGDQSYNFAKASYQQLSEFAQCSKELFDQSTQNLSKNLLKMFEVLTLADIARCQQMVASHGIDNVTDQFTMISEAKGHIKAIHEQAVAALGNDNQFIKESAGRVEEIQKQYNQLYASINAAYDVLTRPVADGMDADGVKKLFEQHRRLQNVSGEGLNCMFNAIRLQKNGLDPADKKYGIGKLRAVARTDEKSDNGWQASVESLPNLATFLNRPMMVFIDQRVDGHNGTGVNIAFPCEGGCQLNIEANHLRRNVSILNTITDRVDGILQDTKTVERATLIARVLGVWNEDQNTMVANLQNMTVRDALVCLLQNQAVIVLYLNGSTHGGHYQSYVMRSQRQQVNERPAPIQMLPAKRPRQRK